MTDINSDQHSPHAVHLVGELQVEQIASHLAVYLLENIRGNRKINLEPFSNSHTLTGDLVEIIELFMLGIQGWVLIPEDHDEHLWESVRISPCDIFLYQLFEIHRIGFVLKFDPVRLFNREA